MKIASLFAVVVVASFPINGFAATEIPVEFTSAGERMVGRLFLPENFDPSSKLPAVVVAPPWLNVKEQVATRYAAAMADRGFAALAFDLRYWGESGGEPREWESAPAKIADLVAAVDFVAARPEVDPDRVALLGICFGAGHTLAAAQQSARIRAVGTVAAWIHDAASLEATFGAEEIARRREAGNRARATFEQGREVAYVPAASATDRTAGMFSPDPEFFYLNPKRGAVRGWTNRMAVMSWPEWLDLHAASFGPSLKVPVVSVHSDGSALPDNVRRLHAEIPGRKHLHWTEGAHLDFYDQPRLVAEASDVIAKHLHEWTK